MFFFIFSSYCLCILCSIVWITNYIRNKKKITNKNKDLQGAGHNISSATIVQLRVSKDENEFSGMEIQYSLHSWTLLLPQKKYATANKQHWEKPKRFPLVFFHIYSTSNFFFSCSSFRTFCAHFQFSCAGILHLPPFSLACAVCFSLPLMIHVYFARSAHPSSISFDTISHTIERMPPSTMWLICEVGRQGLSLCMHEEHVPYWWSWIGVHNVSLARSNHLMGSNNSWGLGAMLCNDFLYVSWMVGEKRLFTCASIIWLVFTPLRQTNQNKMKSNFSLVADLRNRILVNRRRTHRVT